MWCNVCMDVCMDGWTDGSMDRCMPAWLAGCLSVCVCVCQNLFLRAVRFLRFLRFCAFFQSQVQNRGAAWLVTVAVQRGGCYKSLKWILGAESTYLFWSVGRITIFHFFEELGHFLLSWQGGQAKNHPRRSRQHKAFPGIFLLRRRVLKPTTTCGLSSVFRPRFRHGPVVILVLPG